MQISVFSEYLKTIQKVRLILHQRILILNFYIEFICIF